MFEIELKFEVPGDRKTALLAALRRGKVVEQRLQARYYDTADELLARHKIAIRLRKEGPQWVQTLKASTSDSMRRLEHNVVIANARGNEPPALNASLHDGTPAGDALAAVLARRQHTKSKTHDPAVEPALVQRYATDVRRTSREVRVDGSRVEVALDVGWIIAGDARVHICEIEFELKGGPVHGMVSMALRWVNAHGLWLNTVSKAERGTRLARGEQHGPVHKAASLAYGRKLAAPDVLRAVVANCLDQMTANASEVAAGSLDEDHVHQLRVGIRRMRTALREMADFDDVIDPQWEPALQKAFSELGAYRDRETVLGQIEPQLIAAGAPARSGASAAPGTQTGSASDGAAPEPGQTVLAPEFQATLLDLLRLCTTPTPTPAAQPSAAVLATTSASAPTPEAATTPSAIALFTARLKKLHRHVRDDGERFASLDAESQHRVRKRLKRLRYLVEFAAPLFNARKVAQYLDALRPAQDELGTHNDQIVALRDFQKDASTDLHASFATGWLTAKQAESSERCQRTLRRMACSPRFWKKNG